MKPIYLIIVLLFTSCSLFKKDDSKVLDLKGSESFTQAKKPDLYFENITNGYLGFSKDYQIVTGSYASYLNRIALKITRENELLFESKNYKLKYVVVKDDRPFFFSSLPNYIFFSSGLLGKYIKHESILAMIIAMQVVRIHNRVYKEVDILPVGYYTIEDLIKLSRLPLDVKTELHKWSYHIVARAGFDESLYLTWLQLQNRNINRFSIMNERDKDLVYEESLFKNFMIRSNKNLDISKQLQSSKMFYNFINYYGNIK